MSSEAEELQILEDDKKEEKLILVLKQCTKALENLHNETFNARDIVTLLKEHLQEQFLIEFDNGSTSHNRGLLYAQCGTNCQAIINLLNAIVSDLDLIEDLPLHPKIQNEKNVVQIF
jgi:hypothetical protein